MTSPDVNPNRVGISMSVLKNIVRDLNNHPTLRTIFGVPVSAALTVVADNNDLRIEDAGTVPLTQAQQEEFMRILDEVIAANAS